MNFDEYYVYCGTNYEDPGETRRFGLDCWQVARQLRGHEEALGKYLNGRTNVSLSFAENIVSLRGNNNDEDLERSDILLARLIEEGLKQNWSNSDFARKLEDRLWDLVPIPPQWLWSR